MSLSAAQHARLAAASRLPGQPDALCEAIAAVSAEALGCALFTAMRFYPDAGEVERLYSTNRDAYPVGGRKTKRDTAWAKHVLIERRVFVGEGDAAIRAAFDDHRTIAALGLHSIINVPVVAAGRCVGTLNFLMRRDAVSASDVEAAEALGRSAPPAFGPE